MGHAKPSRRRRTPPPHRHPRALALLLIVLSARHAASAPPQDEGQLPPGFANQLLGSGFPRIFAADFLPDGRLLLGEQNTGRVLIADVTELPLVYEEYLQLDDLNRFKERGLLGLLVDNDFPSSPYIYMYYSPDSVKSLRLSRFQHFENQGATSSRSYPTTETVLWSDPDGYNGCCHFGGAMVFGPGGHIYWTIGDQYNSEFSQDLTNNAGKVLCITKTGEFPPGNLGNDGAGPRADAIYAYGLRNPFSLAIDPDNGRMFVGDVGGNDQAIAWEDIHAVHPGLNYGWPLCEGPCDNPDYAATCDCARHDDPLFAYKHERKGASVILGPVYRGGVFPPEYNGALFYGDFVRRWIRFLVLSPDGERVTGDFGFQTGGGRPLRIFAGPDGAVYYTNDDGELRRFVYQSDNSPPRITRARASSTAGSVPLAVLFQVDATDPDGDADLEYVWFLDGVEADGEGATVQRVFNSPGSHRAYAIVSDGQVSITSETIVVDIGESPEVTVAASQATFRAGDDIELVGMATDDDGELGEANFAWEIVFFHNDHSHPVLEGVTGRRARLQIETEGHDYADNVFFRASLTVTDRHGLATTESLSLYPERVLLNISTFPPGLTVHLNSLPIVTPARVPSLVGFRQPFQAAGVVCLEGRRLVLDAERSTILPSMVLQTATADMALRAVYTPRPGACGAFPSQLRGLSLRLSSSSGVQESGGQVQSWRDLSGSGNHLYPVGAPPTVVDGRINGHPAVAFDGAVQSLGLPFPKKLPAGNRGRTVLLVARYTGVVEAEGAAATGLVWGLGACGHFSLGLDAGTGELAVDGNCKGAYRSGVANSARWHLHTAVLEGSVLHQRVDGEPVSAAAKASSATADGAEGAAAWLRLGVSHDGTAHTGLEVAEALVYFRALEADELHQVETYLLGEYSLGARPPVLVLGPVAGVTVPSPAVTVMWACDPDVAFQRFLVRLDLAVVATVADCAGSIAVEASPGRHEVAVGLVPAARASGDEGAVVYSDPVPFTVAPPDPGAPTTTRPQRGSTTTATTTATTTEAAGPTLVHAINCGGPAFVDVAGLAWSADTAFNTGRVASYPGQQVVGAGAVGDTLYQTERWDKSSGSDLKYKLPVPAEGAYLVRLFFTELFAERAGKRVFAVLLQDIKVKQLDIFAEAGYGRALVLDFHLAMAPGDQNIRLRFQHGAANNPKINGIQIWRQADEATLTPGAPPPPTTTTTATATTTTTTTAAAEAPERFLVGNLAFDAQFGGATNVHFKTTFKGKHGVFKVAYDAARGLGANVRACGLECAATPPCLGFSLVVRSDVHSCIGLSKLGRKKMTKKTCLNYKHSVVADSGDSTTTTAATTTTTATTPTTSTSTSTTTTTTYAPLVLLPSGARFAGVATVFRYMWGEGGTMFSPFLYEEASDPRHHLFSIACEAGDLNGCLSKCQERCLEEATCVAIFGLEAGACTALTSAGRKVPGSGPPAVTLRRQEVELAPAPRTESQAFHLYAHYAGLEGIGERFSSAFVDSAVLFRLEFPGTADLSLATFYGTCRQACLGDDDCEGVYVYRLPDEEAGMACHGLSYLGRPVPTSHTSWSFARLMLPLGRVAHLKDYELALSASEAKGGFRFATAYSDDRLFVQRLPPGETTAEAVKADCARLCNLDTDCRGFFFRATAAFLKCWGLSELGGSRATNTASESFARISHESTVVASNSCVQACLTKYAVDGKERAQCALGCRALLNFGSERDLESCETTCTEAFETPVFCHDGCEEALDVVNAAAQEASIEGPTLDEHLYELVFHSGWAFSTALNPEFQLFLSAKTYVGCLLACQESAQCGGAVVFLDSRQDGMKCIGLENLGTPSGAALAAVSYSYAKKGHFKAAKQGTLGSLIANANSKQPPTRAAGSSTSSGFGSTPTFLVVAGVLVVALASVVAWRRAHTKPAPPGVPARIGALKHKTSDLFLTSSLPTVKSGLAPLEESEELRLVEELGRVSNSRYLSAPGRQAGLRARTPTPTFVREATL